MESVTLVAILKHGHKFVDIPPIERSLSYSIWAAINKRNTFLTVLVEKYRIKAPADSVTDEHPLAGSWMAISLLSPHMAKEARSSLGSLLQGH